MLNKRRTRH